MSDVSLIFRRWVFCEKRILWRLEEEELDEWLGFKAGYGGVALVDEEVRSVGYELWSFFFFFFGGGFFGCEYNLLARTCSEFAEEIWT